MKTYIFFLFLLFSLAGCRSQSQPAINPAAGISGNKPLIIEEQAKPEDQYLWDFGKAEKDTVLKHEFMLKNDSSKILNINGVNTSCGCTISESGKKTLLPGESTIIKVEFNTKGYKGEIQQFVYVNTDDSLNPVLRFVIKANIAE